MTRSIQSVPARLRGEPARIDADALDEGERAVLAAVFSPAPRFF